METKEIVVENNSSTSVDIILNNDKEQTNEVTSLNTLPNPLPSDDLAADISGKEADLPEKSKKVEIISDLKLTDDNDILRISDSKSIEGRGDPIENAVAAMKETDEAIKSKVNANNVENTSEFKTIEGVKVIIETDVILDILPPADSLEKPTDLADKPNKVHITNALKITDDHEKENVVNVDALPNQLAEEIVLLVEEQIQNNEIHEIIDLKSVDGNEEPVRKSNANNVDSAIIEGDKEKDVILDTATPADNTEKPTDLAADKTEQPTDLTEKPNQVQITNDLKRTGDHEKENIVSVNVLPLNQLPVDKEAIVANLPEKHVDLTTEKSKNNEILEISDSESVDGSEESVRKLKVKAVDSAIIGGDKEKDVILDTATPADNTEKPTDLSEKPNQVQITSDLNTTDGHQKPMENVINVDALDPLPVEKEAIVANSPEKHVDLTTQKSKNNEILEISDSESVDGSEEPVRILNATNVDSVIIQGDKEKAVILDTSPPADRTEKLADLAEKPNQVQITRDFNKTDGHQKQIENVINVDDLPLSPLPVDKAAIDVDLTTQKRKYTEILEISDSESVDGAEELIVGAIEVEHETDESIKSKVNGKNLEKNRNLVPKEKVPILVTTTSAESPRKVADLPKNVRKDIEIHEISDSESVDGAHDHSETLVEPIELDAEPNVEPIVTIQQKTSSNEVHEISDTESVHESDDPSDITLTAQNEDTVEIIQRESVNRIIDSESLDGFDESLQSVNKYRRVEAESHVNKKISTKKPVGSNNKPTSSKANEVHDMSDSPSVDGVENPSEKLDVAPPTVESNSNKVHEICDSESIDVSQIEKASTVVQSVENVTTNKETQLHETNEPDAALILDIDEVEEVIVKAPIIEISDEDDNVEEGQPTPPPPPSIRGLIKTSPAFNTPTSRPTSGFRTFTPQTPVNNRVAIYSPSQEKGNVCGLVGVEFVIKVLKFAYDNRPSYNCCLCEKQNNAIGMQEHLESTYHRLNYCKKYFPTAITQFRKCVFNMESNLASKVMALLLRKLTYNIELHYGRELPHSSYKNVYMLKSNEIIDRIFSAKHASEETGPSFTHLIDSIQMEQLITQAKNGVTVPLQSQPIFDTALKKQLSNNMTNNKETKNYNNSHGQRGRQQSRYGTNSMREFPTTNQRHPLSNISRVSQPREAPFQLSINPFEHTDSQQRVFLKRPLQNQIAEISHALYKRPNLAQLTESPESLPNPFKRQLVSPMTDQHRNEKFIKDKYQRMLAEKKKEIEALFCCFSISPETHESFNEEWLRYYKNRKLQLKTSGADPNNYDYENEFKTYFLKRLNKLREELWEKERKEISQKLKFELSTFNKAQSSQLPPKESLLDVVRKLSKFEDLLGEYRDKVLSLIFQTFRMESENKSHVNQLLNQENVCTLQNLKYRFHGLLANNRVAEERKPELQLVIDGMTQLLACFP